MEADYKHRIKTNLTLLKRCIDPTDELIDHFSFIDELDSDMVHIHLKPTSEAKVMSLLTILRRKSTGVIDEICKILGEHDQEHAACLLNGIPSPGKEFMTDDHHTELCVKLCQLRQFLDPVGGLLEELMSTRTFQLRDRERVNAKKVIDDMAGEVVLILMRMCDQAFQDFITALNKTDQKHVVYILNGEGEPPLTVAQVHVLREMRPVLIQNILVQGSGLLEFLHSEGAFSLYDQQWILAAETSKEITARLLDVLQRRPASAFGKFIVSLAKSKHEHVIDEIMRKKKVSSAVRPEFTCELSAEEITAAEHKLIEIINYSDDVQQLQKDGILLEASSGSISIHFNCMSIKAIDYLQTLYNSSKLNELLNNIMRPWFSTLAIRSLDIKIDESQFSICRSDFENSTLMTDQHRQILQMAAERLIQEIHVTDLLVHLEMDALRREAIEKTKQNDEKVRVLLDIVSRQPDQAFGELLSALRKTGQDRVAHAMECSLLSAESVDGKHEGQSAALDRIVLNDMKEKLNNIASCPICQDIFINPRVLPCLHSFCLKCLEDQNKNKGSGDMACCAMCKTEFTIPEMGIKGIPRNFQMDELISVVASSNKTLDCEHGCTDESEDIEPETKKRRVTQCGDDAEKAIPSCDVHPVEKLRIYCMDCRVSTCLICCRQTHRLHRVYEMDEIVDELRSAMKLNIPRMADVANTCHKLMKHISWKKEEQLGQRNKREVEICQHATMISQFVAQQSEELVAEMASTVQDKMATIENVIEEIQLHMNSAELIARNSAEIANNGSAVAVAEQLNTFRDQANELMNIDSLQRAVNDLVSVDIAFKASSLPTTSNGAMIGRIEVNRATVVKSTSPTLTHVIPSNNRAVVGVTSINGRLYVLRAPSEQQLEVYDDRTFVLKNLIRVTELSDHITGDCITGDCGLVSCATNNCLYVGDYDKKTIYKVDLATNLIMKWHVQDSPSGLSVNTQQCNVIATFTRSSKLKEYTKSGLLVRVIVLPSEVSGALHAIQLTADQFVVSHRGQADGVSTVDTGGRVLESYRNTPQVKLLNCPARLAVDPKSRSVIVADSGNNRLLVLNSSLNGYMELSLPVDDLIGPYCLHLDASSGRLYVGESDGQCVLVFDNVRNFVVNSSVTPNSSQKQSNTEFSSLATTIDSY